MPANVEEVARRLWRLALWMVLLVAALAAMWWSVAGFELKPSYHRRNAAEWLDAANQPSPDGPQAEAAFRAMGAQGIRFLARAATTEPFELPKRVDEFFRNHEFPEWADLTKITDKRQEILNDRRDKAISLLHDLGREAAPALPFLVRAFRRGDDAAGELMVPLADKVDFLVPELIVDLRRANWQRWRIDIELLGGMGPGASNAIPALADIARSGTPHADVAAAALWNIDRETNFLIQCISDNLKIRSGFVYEYALDSLNGCVPLPQPLVPLLEEALHHPNLNVRRQAMRFLSRIDPARLRAIAQHLNEHQDQALHDLLELLQSDQTIDQINAMIGIQFLDVPAAVAAPRLAELAIQVVSLGNIPSPGVPAERRQSAILACRVLRGLGPEAAAAIPALRADLATNGDKQMRAAVAQALASVDPGDTNAVDIAREKDRAYLAGLRNTPLGAALEAFALWKMGAANAPVNELVSAGRKVGWLFVVEPLAEIGPLATNALPFLEEKFDPLNPEFGVALAIQKIDPNEAKRLGLPGLLILCPDKY
jgi:HEAT repeat protein